ncbi:MAG: response regulator [Candidatus Aceula lacicola]|nr:response regulator [Candidatus Aceula lacicola]
MGEKKKILVVDDEKDLRELLKMNLEEKGYEVFTACNGEDGLKVAKEIIPDLIISDILMPKIDGSHFLKNLRETHFGKNILFIAMTARGKMRDYFETAGANGFIEKPFSRDTLVETIEKTFEQTKKHTSVTAPKRVLVVSRYENCAQEMVQLLQAENCHTDFVVKCEQVVSKAVMFLPNIIIIESRMFDMGSNAAIRILRQMPQFKRTPILIYNYYDDAELKDDTPEQKNLEMTFFVNTCIDEGATGFIGHFIPSEFIEKINKYLKKGSIVVIDDDESVTLMLKKRLEAEGYYVLAAPDAETGLDLIHKIKPNLIILDIVMPKVSGYEALGIIKTDPNTKNIPVIMLTIKGSSSEIKKALDLGADDYVIKPCNVDLLSKRIETFLKIL